MRILAGPRREPFVSYFFRLELSGYDVLTFDDREPGLHFTGSTGHFDQVLQALPAGWQPDLVIWWLPEFQTVVPGLESCPYPTLLVVSDWHFCSDPILDIASMFDLVATDIRGMELLAGRPEIPAFHASLYGYVPDLHRVLPDIPVDYDVSFVGDLHPYLRAERVEVLARIAEDLDARWTVRYFQDVFLEPYAEIVNGSRISINVSQRGEMNMRCFEVAACGSLLFCEASNREARQVFEDRVHCVYYTPDNLLELLEHYLENESERARIAAAGRARIAGYSYAELGRKLIEQARERLPEVRRRPFLELPEDEQIRRWANYAYHVSNRYPPRHASRYRGDSAEMLNILGCEQAALAAASPDLAWRKPRHLQAIEWLRGALSLGLLPHLSLAQVMFDAGFKPEALEVLEQAQNQPFQEVAYYPRGRDPFSVLWESDRAGRERSARWRLYDLLSQVRPERALEYCDLALAQRDDMAMTWFRRSWYFPWESDERLRSLQSCCRLAPTFIWGRLALARAWLSRGQASEAVALLQRTSDLIIRYPFSPLVKAAFERTLLSFSRPAPEPAAGERMEDYLAAVSFRWLHPEDPLPRHLEGREGTELEFQNTDFGPFDADLKARLLRLDTVPRMSSLTIGALLWWAVRHMSPEHCYVNVGVWNGFTFLSGLIDNPDKICIGVDNFSEFDGPKEAFERQFSRFAGDRHHFHEMDYVEYFQKQHQGPIGVYLYDGPHSYDHQYRGLQVAEPFFAPGCIVLVDDTNWEPVTRANEDFIRASSRRYEKLFEVKTTAMKHPTWWNGVQVWRCLE